MITAFSKISLKIQGRFPLSGRTL